MYGCVRTIKYRRRDGVTLIELLVVVAIAVLLVATAVPLMKPALQDGRLRESARQLNVFIQVARARAIETGRTTALQIERGAPGSNAAYQIYLAQTPLPYSGDTLTAMATISVPSQVNFDAQSATLPSLVRVGDVIKFDYKGKFYKVTSVSNSGSPSITVQVSATHTLPPDGSMLRYQIFRRPKKSLLAPLQFTGSTVIDLQYSGIGPSTTYDGAGDEQSGREFQAAGGTDNIPVVIAFSPSGAVDHISYGVATGPSTVANQTATPTGMIHLLLGQNDQVGESVADAPPDAPNPIARTGTVTSKTHSYTQNAADLRNIWVTINPTTGSVTSAENAWKAVSLNQANPVNFQDSFLVAREFAQSAQAMGGR